MYSRYVQLKHLQFKHHLKIEETKIKTIINIQFFFIVKHA